MGEQGFPRQVASFRKFIFSVLVILMLSSQAVAGTVSYGLESDSEGSQLDAGRDSEYLSAPSPGQNRSVGAEICTNCTKKQVTKIKVEKMNASRIQDELKSIREKIAQKKVKWTPKETAVSRLSLKDRKSLFGAKFDSISKLSSLSIPGGVSVPIGTFDWRSVNGSSWMTPVKNQGPCGSCWAFGTLGSMEAVINIASRDPNKDVDLSEQFLVSCCKGNYPLCGFGCSGGYPNAAYEYIKNNGIPDEACFPYVASDVSCSHCSDWQSRAWFITSWDWVSSDRDSIKWVLRTYGPLGVAMYAPNDFLYYGGGIYESVWSSQEWDEEFPLGSVNHWVTLAGYDDAQGYWIVKNSWGEGWGEQGYGKIAYGILEQHGYILAIQSVRCSSTPEHDMEVSLQAPSILQPGTQTLLNATVRNKGLTDEANVVLRLLANGTTIYSQSFPSLLKGESKSINYTWTPTAEGWHNITAYSPPLQGETLISNNAVSKWTAATSERVLLVVDDDGSYAVSGTSQARFEAALKDNGINFFVWIESDHGRPSLNALKMFGTVIWTCGDYWSGAVDSTDAASLTSYLSEGGAILLEGEDIAYDHGNDAFMSSVAHAYYNVDKVGSAGIHKAASHSVSNGLPDYMYWQTAPPYDDGVTPSDGGIKIFEYYNPTSYSAIVVSGTGGNGSTVYLAYPLYCMFSVDARSLVENVVDWLYPTYLVTLDTNPRVASLTADGVTYSSSELPRSFAYASGSTHTFNVSSTVSGGTRLHYVFTEWTDGITSVSRTVTITASTSYMANFKTQYYLIVNTYPAGLDAPAGQGWYDSGGNAPISVAAVPDYTFQYWYLDGQATNPYSNNTSASVVMSVPHTATGYFKAASTISLTVSSSSLNYGESNALSGLISPARPSVPVILSYHLNGGTNWTPFMTVRTAADGSYSAAWTPPYPSGYMIRASWDGDHDYVGATSTEYAVTVTGVMPSNPRLQLTLEATWFSRGGGAWLAVTVYNTAETVLQSELYIEIHGPEGYRHYDSTSITLAGSSEMPYYFKWNIPDDAIVGNYQVLTGLVPPLLDAYDTGYVQVT